MDFSLAMEINIGVIVQAGIRIIDYPQINWAIQSRLLCKGGVLVIVCCASNPERPAMRLW